MCWGIPRTHGPFLGPHLVTIGDVLSYDPGLPNNKDKVRHLIGDTDPDQEFLEDTEIQFHLDQEGTVRRAAAQCARAIAARLAADTDYRFSTLWSDASQAYKHFMDLARVLDQQNTGNIKAKYTGLGPDDGIYGEPIFGIAMHDFIQNTPSTDDDEVTNE